MLPYFRYHILLSHFGIYRIGEEQVEKEIWVHIHVRWIVGMGSGWVFVSGCCTVGTVRTQDRTSRICRCESSR